MGWPVVYAAGGPRERGRAYGEGARDRVHRSIELYEAIFRHYAGLGWNEVRGRAGAFAEPIDHLDVQLLPEMEGIAQGARVEAEDILALNVRTEVMFGLGTREGAAECTALALDGTRTSNGHVLLAQTWDWKPAARDSSVILAMSPHRGPSFVTFVEAGLLAKCGLNERGVGVAANALVSSRDRGEPGAPFHAILRTILASSTLDEALDRVTGPIRASSANYLMGDRHAIADAEAAPGGPDMVEVTRGETLVHANHFLRLDRPFKDVTLLEGSDSLERQASITDGLQEAGLRDRDGVLGLLRTHSPDRGDGSVCAHGDPQLPREADYVTIAAVVMDLTDGALDVTDANPCESDVSRFEVASLSAEATAGVSL